METPGGGEFLSMYSIADYEAAIQKAPPGTLIKLGDLDAAFLTCTTCKAKMPPEQTPFHKHLEPCQHCGQTIDINMVAHDPVVETKKAGHGDITYTSGCKERAL